LQSGQAIVTISDANGRRRDVLLGQFDSPESHLAYQRQLALLSAVPAVVPSAAVPPATLGATDITFAELAIAFLAHAEKHYRHPDGRPTGEIANYHMAIRHAREMCGSLLAAEFGPKLLKAVREKMVAAKWCRRQVNQGVDRLKRMFKWAASEELIPAGVFHALQTVAGLQAGRTAAPDRPGVLPVSDAAVDATLPYLNRHVRGLIEFQRLTGCRPGEACAIRVADIDKAGDVWVFRPAHHKNSYRGTKRSIAIGPKAQTLIERFATDNPEDFLFSPSRCVAEGIAERAAARKTPRYPSHMKRNAAKRVAAPKRAPDEQYTSMVIAHAVRRAVQLANRDGCRNPEYGPTLPLVPPWHPNQIRHLYATTVRREYGLEAAQVSLGHSKADTTQIYAEKNEALAASVAAKIG